MCGYLKRLYSPYNLKQVDPAQQMQAATPTNPTTAVVPGGAASLFVSPLTQDPYHLQVGIHDKNVHFDEDSLLSQTLDEINHTLAQLAEDDFRSNRRDRNPTRPNCTSPISLRDVMGIP